MQKGRIKEALNAAQCRVYRTSAEWRQCVICDAVTDEIKPGEKMMNFAFFHFFFFIFVEIKKGERSFTTSTLSMRYSER